MTLTSRGLWSAAAVAAALAAVSASLPPPLAVVVLAVTWLVTPGALVASRLHAEETPGTRLLATLALSPFLAGAPFAALAAAGVPMRAAAMGVSLALGVLAIVAARAAVSGTGRVRVAAPWPALVWALVVAALLAGNRFLALRSDGWFHTAVVAQVAARGVPPEDPYFAGLRLLYFWGTHAWAAAWLVLAPRLAAWTPLVALNISGALAVVLGVGAVAERLGARSRDVALAGVLAVAGYAPFAWIQVAGRVVTGNMQGWEEVLRLVTKGVDPLLVMLATGQLHASLAFFGDKYLVLTPFGMGLALLALGASNAIALMAAPTPRRALAFGVTFAATLFTHTVVGYALALLVSAWWAWRALAAVRGDRGARAVLLPMALAGAGAVLLLSPYLAAITLGKEGQLSAAGLSTRALWSLAGGGALIVPMGFFQLARTSRRSLESAALLVAATLVVVLAMALRLPENNQSKFLNFLLLLLSAPAAMGWNAALERLAPPARALAGGVMALAALPTLALALWGFASERGQTANSWHESSPDMRAACDWLRDSTRADAVLCDVGGAREFLVYGARSVYWGGRSGERNWGYAPARITERRALVSSLCLAQAPQGDAARLLGASTREVYVAARAFAPDSLVDSLALASALERFEPVFHNGAVAFFRVRRQP